MSHNAKALADLLGSFAHQPPRTTEDHQLQSDVRVLASVLIAALRHHAPADVATWIRWRLRTSQRPDHRSVTAVSEDDLARQLNDVRRIRKVAKRRKRNGSKLDACRAELLELRRQGASWSDLQAWLRRYPRIKVDRSTVIRRVRVWLGESDG